MNEAAIDSTTAQLMLPIGRVFANPDQPRRLFSAKALESLAQSIKEHGVIVPIAVVKRDQGYMIIGGERRYRASKLAGMAVIPARIIEADSRKVAEMALVENIQRADLNLIEEAAGYRDLIERGVTMDEIARKMGFKQAWRVRERLELLKLDPMYQRFLIDKRITPSQATELARLPVDKQHVLYRKIEDGKADTYNKLRALTNALLAPPPKQVEFGPSLSEEQVLVGKRYDSLVDSLCRFVTRSFSRDDLKILRKVVRSTAGVNIRKLDLIIRELRKIRHAMIEAQGKGEIS